eukprot:1895704-Amphidinium_carterae.1
MEFLCLGAYEDIVDFQYCLSSSPVSTDNKSKVVRARACEVRHCENMSFSCQCQYQHHGSVSSSSSLTHLVTIPDILRRRTLSVKYNGSGYE